MDVENYGKIKRQKKVKQNRSFDFKLFHYKKV